MKNNQLPMILASGDAKCPAFLNFSGDGGELVSLQAASSETKNRTFSMVAYTGGTMLVGGWPFPVAIELSGLKVSKHPRPILKDHDPGKVVGHTTNVDVSKQRIKVSGEISGANQHAREVVESSDNNFPWQSSVGVRPERVVFVDEGDSEQVNGRAVQGPAYVVRAGSLKEISFVALGADDKTSAVVAAGNTDSYIEVLAMDFDKWLTACGFDAAELNETQLKALKAKYEECDQALDAATIPITPAKPAEPIAQVAASTGDIAAAESTKLIREEAVRINAINAAAQGHPDVAAKAIEGGWDVEKTKTECELLDLRASRPQAPALIIGNGDAPSAQVVEASLLLAGGMTEGQVSKHYKEPVMDQAVSAGFRNLSISGLVQMVCASAGKHIRAGRLDEDTIRAAFEADQSIVRAASGASTVSLSGVLSNIAQKSLLSAYGTVADVTSKFVATGSNTDFKTASRYRLTADGSFKKVGADGRLKHISLQEDSYTAKVDTDGAIVGLTRKMMINDDLGALMQLTRILGRAAAISKQREIFTMLLSNPNGFFSSANKNIVTTNPLNISGLTAAERLFLDQTDDNGDPVMITPSVLLTGTGLKTTAESVYKETKVNETTTANKKSTTDNPHAGKFDPVSSPWVNAQSLAGSSATDWYLFGDPNDVAAMEITYLNGRNTPFLDSAQLDFDQLGMQWRAYQDFGVSMQDPRGAVKCTA